MALLLGLGLTFPSAATAQSWTASSLPSYVTALGKATCPSAGRCFAVGWDDPDSTAVALVSTDDGATWSGQKVVGARYLDGIDCTDSSHCWAVGWATTGNTSPGAVVQTSDGGQSWHSDSLPAGVYGLRRISCVASSCWAVGPNAGSNVVSTHDGGKSWSVTNAMPCNAALCPGYNLEDVIFVNAQVGLAVGGQMCGGQGVTQCPAAIFRTTDGGSTWSNVAPSNMPFAGGVSCSDTESCWVATSTFSAGEVFASLDGGQNWQLEQLPSVSEAYALNDVSCASQLNGVPPLCWAVGQASPQAGSHAVAFVTANGGNTWRPDDPAGGGPLYSVFTEISDVALAGGQKGSAGELLRAPPPLAVHGRVVEGVADQTVGYPWVATFGGSSAGGYSASVDWGDGTSSPAQVISLGSGAYQCYYLGQAVYGTCYAVIALSHKYERAGAIPLTVHVSGPGSSGSDAGIAEIVPSIARSVDQATAPNIGVVTFQPDGTLVNTGCTASVLAGLNVIMTAHHCPGNWQTAEFRFHVGDSEYWCASRQDDSFYSPLPDLSPGDPGEGPDGPLFLAMNPCGSDRSLSSAASGGLPITFNPSRGQLWHIAGFAVREGSSGMTTCDVTDETTSGRVSELDGWMYGAPCTVPGTHGGGMSGAPWVNTSGLSAHGAGIPGIGAIQKAWCQTPCDFHPPLVTGQHQGQGYAFGLYLGDTSMSEYIRAALTATFAPQLGIAGVTNSIFEISRRPTPVRGRSIAADAASPDAATAAVRRGTVFRYRLLLGATVRIAIEHPTTGVRHRGACVKPGSRGAPRHGRRCVRWVATGTLIRTSHIGLNRVPFSGRIGRRPLTPGHYRAELRSFDTKHNQSPPKFVYFRVVQG